MQEHYPFVRDDILPSFWANAIQRFLSNYVSPNLRLTQQDATHVQVVAGADEDAAVVAIDGNWRWNEATVTRAHPGGAAATFDVFVTAKANAIVGVPAPFTDNTDYSFALAIVAHNATPPIVGGVVDIFRKIGELAWDGAAITAVTQLAGTTTAEVTQAELDAEAAARVAADALKQPLDGDLTAIGALVSGADLIAYATGAQAWALTALTTLARTLLGNATAAAMRGTLGLVIGTDVEAHDADLTAIAALGSAADKLPYATGPQAWALTTLSAFVRTLLDDANAGAFLTTLGVSAFVQTVLDDADAPAVRTTLGSASALDALILAAALGPSPAAADRLAQGALVASTDTSVYTAPAGSQVVVTAIQMKNTGAVTGGCDVGINGIAENDEVALVSNITAGNASNALQNNSYSNPGKPFILNPGDVLHLKDLSADTWTYTVFGFVVPSPTGLVPKRLGKGTIAASGSTSAYTVPAGKRAIITSIRARNKTGGVNAQVESYVGGTGVNNRAWFFGSVAAGTLVDVLANGNMASPNQTIGMPAADVLTLKDAGGSAWSYTVFGIEVPY